MAYQVAIMVTHYQISVGHGTVGYFYFLKRITGYLHQTRPSFIVVFVRVSSKVVIYKLICFSAPEVATCMRYREQPRLKSTAREYFQIMFQSCNFKNRNHSIFVLFDQLLIIMFVINCQLILKENRTILNIRRDNSHRLLASFKQ